MQLFLFFILGIAFIQWVVPVFDGIFSLILAKIEISKGNCSKKITQINKDIAEIRGALAQEESHLIGFQYPEDNEEEEDGNDEIL